MSIGHHFFNTRNVMACLVIVMALTSAPLHADVMGLYFSGNNFNTRVGTRCDENINFSWGTGGPFGQSENFTIRWHGWLHVPVEGTWNFTANTDDGIRLYIDGTVVINRFEAFAGTLNGSVYLTAGPHWIQYDFLEVGGGASTQLVWSCAGWNGGAAAVVAKEYLSIGMTKTDAIDTSRVMTFYSQPANTALAGDATLQTADGMHWVQLTPPPPDGGKQGTLYYNPGRTLKSFRLRCDLFLGDGTGTAADGVAFCYGPLNWAGSFGEDGVGPGLVVRNKTYNVDSFDIYYNNTLVSHQNVEWVNNRWAPFEISVDENGACSVLHDNGLQATVQIPGWNPQSNWTVGIGGRTGGEITRQCIDNLYVGTSEPFAESVLRNNASPVGGATTSVSYKVAFNEWLTAPQVSDFEVVNAGGTAAATVTGVSVPSINVSQNFASTALPGALSGNATVTGGYLRLTEEAGGQKGTWTWAPGVALPAFHMSFRQEFVTAGTPADGMNVVYGPDAGIYGVQGPDSGLAVSFDTYDNGQEGTPCIRIKYNGVIYSRVIRALHNQGWQPTEIGVTREGLVSVVYGNIRYGLDLPLPGWNPQASWQFGITAYTGGSFEQHRIDDLQIRSSDYTVTLGSLSGQGSVRLNVVPTSAQITDYAGNRVASSYTSGELYAFDFVAPAVTGINVVNGSTVDVTFGEAMGASAETAANYYVSGSGTGTLAEHPNSAASMGGNVYRLTWSSGEMLNGGDITVTVLSVQDALGNAIGSSNTATDTGAAIGTAPSVTGVAVQGARVVDVTFSEPMGSGVSTAANYTLSGGGKGTLAGTPDSAVFQSGSTYRLTWNSGEMRQGGDITIQAASVSDAAGNAIGAGNSATDAGGGIGSAPGISSVAVQAARTINVTFNEAMGAGTDVAANYTVGGSGIGTLSPHPDGAALVSGNTYQLTWTAGEMLGGSDITVVVTNAADAAGNLIGTSNSATHVGGAIGVPPAVMSVNVFDALTVDVEFSEALGAGALTEAHYQISGAGRGSLDAAPADVVALSATAYRLTWGAGEMVNGASVVITVTNVQDAIGNAIGSSNSGTDINGGIGTPPAVTAVAVQGALVVDVTFDEPMDMGVTTAANYSVSGSGRGTLALHPNGVSQFGPTTYRLTWAGGEMRNGGDMTVTVQNAKDVAGNVVSASANSGTDIGGGIGTSPDTAIGSMSPMITRISPISVIVQFSESVTGFTDSDIDVGNGTITGFSGSADLYAFVVTPSSQGLVTVDVEAGVCTDAAGNPNTVALQLSRTYDTTRPQPVMATTASNPTTQSPIPVTVTFVEDVTGFEEGDVEVENATLVNFSGSGMNYAFDLVPAAVGTVRADIPADVCTDVAGNTNTAAIQLSRSFTSPRPTVVITADTPTNQTTLSVTVTFSLPVTGFEEGDVLVNGGGSVSNFAGAGAVYTFDLLLSGNATVEVPENTATAAGGHLNFGQELTVVYDAVAPELELVTATLEPDYVGTVEVTATFDEPVEGFEASDIDVANGTVANFAGSGADYSFDIEPTGAGVVTATVETGAAEDAAGNPADGATLSRTLYELLALATQPDDVTIAPGETWEFSVTTTGGIPPLAYQWSKGGVDILDATEATYTVADAVIEDSGLYECTVSDGGTQNVVTDGAMLTVSRGLPAAGAAALGLLAAILGIGSTRTIRRRK